METPPNKSRFSVAHATDVGGRESDEDAVYVTELLPVRKWKSATDGGYLIAVADGMGGYQRGEVAKRNGDRGGEGDVRRRPWRGYRSSSQAGLPTRQRSNFRKR